MDSIQLQDGDIIPVLAILLAFILGFIGLTGGLMIGLVKAWRRENWRAPIPTYTSGLGKRG